MKNKKVTIEENINSIFLRTHTVSSKDIDDVSIEVITRTKCGGNRNEVRLSLKAVMFMSITLAITALLALTIYLNITIN